MKAIVFYIETGNGFKSPAEAIARELADNGVDARAVDFYPAIGVSLIYRSFQAVWQFCLRNEWFFIPVFVLSNSFLNRLGTIWQVPFIARRLTRYLERENPDFIVSTHFLSTVLLERFAHGMKPRPIPCFGYNADVILSHRAYVHKKVDGYFISTTIGRDAMIRQGMPAELVHVTGFPIGAPYRAAFRSRAEERAALGLPDMFTLLVTFGGEGIGNWSLVKDIVARSLPIQVVAVCGKNTAVKAELDALSATATTTRLVTTGFVKNLHQYLYCCDISAGKAGLNTAFESIYLKKPFLALKAMANEKHCARFMVDQGYGWYPRTTADALSIVTGALEGSADYARVVRNLQSPPCGFSLGDMVTTMLTVSGEKNRATLRGARALCFDLAGTLCDIPIEGSWEKVNEDGFRNVMTLLRAEEFLSAEEMTALATAFVQEKKKLRKAAKVNLREYEIRAQLGAFFTARRSGSRGLDNLLAARAPDTASWREIERAYMKPELDITVPFPEARGVLSALATRYPLYLLSNNVSHLLIDDILAACFLEGLFTKIIVSSDVGYRKPHPRFMAEVRRQTGRARECVMIGDRLTQDIKMAHDFGMLSVHAAMVTHVDNDGVEGIHATARIASLKELTELFGV